MAIAVAGTVQVDFEANAAAFARQLDKGVSAPLKSLESKFSGLESAAKKALGFLSVGFAIGFVKSAAEAADNAGKLADKLGLSTEKLAAFQLAAADAGVSQESFNKLLIDAQRRLGDAAFGTGEALKTIQSFGLNIRELQRLSPDELFLRYADAIGTLKNRSDQFSAAQALFGKSAQESFTLIAAGRPAVEEAAATVDRLGLALSRVDTFKIEAANDKLSLLGRVSQAVGQQLAAALAPFVSDFVDQLTHAGVAADDARSKFETFAKTAFVAFQIVANAANTFDAAVSGVFLATFRTFEQLNEVVAKGLDLTAKLDRAVGLDKLAKFFSDQASAQRSLAGFAGAAADEASARVQTALGNIKSFQDIFAEIDRIESAAQKRAEDAAAAQQRLNESLGSGADPQLEAFNTNLLLKEDLQRLSNERLLEQQRIFAETSAKLVTELDHDQFVRQQNERVQLAIQAENAILTVRQGAANAAIGLLQALAAKSKTAAIALVAINKALAIQQAVQNISVAVTKTLAAYGGTPAGYAAAAAVKAWGALEIAAIVGTGIAEIQQIRSSPSAGAPLGSPTNPVFTDTGGTGTQTFGAQQRAQINVTVEGVITEGAARAIADALKDVIDNADVHIIGPNSSQGQALRGG